VLLRGGRNTHIGRVSRFLQPIIKGGNRRAICCGD